MKLRILSLSLLTAAAGFGSSASSSPALWPARRVLADSVRDVAADSALGEVRIVRTNLAAAEAAAPLDFVVSLRLRNYAQLQSVLQAGGTVSREEMEANYLPLQADYDRLTSWLKSQGFQITLTDSRHTHAFARGPVSQIASALQTTFARVATADGEFTAAISAPTLPAEVGADVIGIEGLQPYIRMHPAIAPVTADFTHPTRAIPADLIAAYHVPANLTGAGQTIAVFSSQPPLATDLATFYQDAGIASNDANFTVVPINGGPLETGPAGSGFNEVSMDTEWSTGIAPGASLVVYACPTGGLADFMATCASILNTGGFNILTSSFSNPETSEPSASLESSSELLAQMAAAGISVFHGAGDSGAYGSPEYPTTDPYVTALSGTTITYNASWNEVSEVVWPNTGGGYSSFFPKPAWQQGPGVPAGAMRCVPDAASPASMVAPGGASLSFVVLDGSTGTGVGGSSETGPVWAGLTALINQARAQSGLRPVGLYGPKIYPLIGTSAFTDITSGNDGAYSAGPGYDLCSGVGTPVVNALIQALAAEPNVAVQPQSQTLVAGAMLALNASGTGSPAPTYQWYCNGAAISGATGPRLVINNVTAAVAGAYTCALTNSLSSVSTQAANVTVQSSANPGRLVNLSVLTLAGASQPLAVGFVSGGAATSGSQTLLLRAAGPALENFGVSPVLADPMLTLFEGTTAMAANNGWGANATAVAAAETATGAFPFVVGSYDAAIVSSLSSGDYSVQVSGSGTASGNVLAEIYDDTPGGYQPSFTRLINLSCLSQVSSGTTLSAGFVVGGVTSETVLVRASGPSLTSFGVAGTLPDPQIQLFGKVNGQETVIASNAGWAGDPQIAAAAAAVQAFSFASATSADSAVLITLPPGNYSAEVTSPSNATGNCLIEVYEVP